MSYVMSMVQPYLNDDSLYATWADLQVGSNGDANGAPTSSIGDLYGEENWAFNTWDSSPNGGFDTSNVPIAFDVTSSGNESLSIADTEPLTYQANSIGPISSVVLEAAVQTNATAGWSNVSIAFLNNGSILEVDNFANGPQVNTVNSGPLNVADQTLTVTPSVPNSDEVRVSGLMRMTSPGANYPAPEAMFCNIFINGANASSSGTGTGIGIGAGSNESGG